MNQSRQAMVFWVGGAILVAGLVPILAARFLIGDSVSSASSATPVCHVSLLTQWLVVLTAFVVKPTYMLLSLMVVVWLWRQTAPDLGALRRGMASFLAGEAACAINYLAWAGRSELWEYLHGYGMAVGFAFVTYAVLEGIDRRLVKYSAPKDRCAALSLCRACIKYADVPCGLRRLFAVMIPALIVVALIPWSAPVRQDVCRVEVFGSTQDYTLSVWSQLFEMRYCPGLAITLLAASWLVLLLKREDPVRWSKMLLAAASGPLGFGLMRLALNSVYRDRPAWSGLWEELTELLFVIAVVVALWLFRAGLLAPAPAGAVETTRSPESGA